MAGAVCAVRFGLVRSRKAGQRQPTSNFSGSGGSINYMCHMAACQWNGYAVGPLLFIRRTMGVVLFSWQRGRSEGASFLACLIAGRQVSGLGARYAGDGQCAISCGFDIQYRCRSGVHMQLLFLFATGDGWVSVPRQGVGHASIRYW